MFDSNYNANNNNNLTYYDQYDNNEAQLLNFNSRMLDHDDLFLDTILLPYHPPPPPPPPPPQLPSSTISKKGLDKGMKKSGGSHSKGRKTGKKDRHSKIYTAQGPRDRRMRLSLQIARKFFDLQDMLGFDKASKTIEWLFNKSRAAIKDLSEKSCTSLIIPNYEKFDEKNEENKCEKKSSKIKNGGKKEKIMSKLNEKRKEARARARERTKEKLKMMNKKLDLGMEKNPNEESIVQEKVLEDQMACVGIVEKFLGASSSSSMVNYNGQDNDLSLGFSMEYPRNESGRSTNGGFMEGTLEYVHQVDQVGPNPNCAFMGRGFNQGY